MSSAANPSSLATDSSTSTTVTRVAVAGAGFMGGGIAAEMALRVPRLESVALWDAVEGAAERAVERAQDVVVALQSAGVLTPTEAAVRLPRLRAARSLEEALDGAEYVAEAVPEDLALKQQVFKKLDAASSPTAVLASNTSGYDPADLAIDLSHPERVVVAHYFGPAYLIPAVEVVPHVATAGWAIERTEAILRAAGKRPIRLGKCVPGFIANRLQQALFREALWLIREGVASPEALDEVVRFSFGPRLAALGPITVSDFAGLDVYESLALNVWPTLSTEHCREAPPPEISGRLQSKRLGVKAGAGFYDWPEDHKREITARRDSALAAALGALADSPAQASADKPAG
jgi:3-hydroxybutyryl-CoA dehydrogenase